MTDNDPTTYGDDGADLTADGGDVLSAAERAMQGLSQKAARPGSLPDDPTPWGDTPFLEMQSGDLSADELTTLRHVALLAHGAGHDGMDPGLAQDRVIATVRRILAARAAADEEARGRLAAEVRAAACECGGDAVRFTVGAERSCPVHGYGTHAEWRHIAAALAAPVAAHPEQGGAS